MGGKRKIPMDQRRETREQRSVSFTKRRQGLYKKAVELCLFGGAQVAIVMSSPCTSRNLYSLGHPSVDAVFDAFLEGRPPVGCGDAGDGGVSRSVAVSLYEEMKALERGEPDEIRKRRRMKKSESGDAEFWREFEVLEKSCESAEELQVLVENLENLKEKALNRLMTTTTTTTITSDTSPPSSFYLFNSAVNFVCLDDNRNTDIVDSGAPVIAAFSNNNDNNNHQDANCNTNGVESNLMDRVSTSDFINVDENSVVGEDNEESNNVTETDSITAHILDSFALDDDCHNIEGLICPLYPDHHHHHHHQDQPSEPIDAPPVTRVSDFRHLINFL